MLERMSLGERVVFSIVVIVLLLLLMALFGWVEGRWDDARAEEVQLYRGIPTDAHLLELDKSALNEAYHNQVVRLFGVWLSGGVKEATQFTNGLQNARRGYNLAIQQIEKRERELEQTGDRK